MTANLVSSLPATEAAGLKPVLDYLPFVRRVVMRVARRLPSHVQVEDLLGAGVIGLIEAMERFNPARFTDFETFAEFRVKGAVLDELRRRDLMARDARIEAKQIEQIITALRQRLAREPEQEDVAEALGLSLAEYQHKLEKLAPVRLLSFEDLQSAEQVATGKDGFELAALVELRDRLAVAIAQLNPRHALILHLYYRDELTLREIGEVLSVTESRVCQILAEATLRLRSLLGVPEKPKDAATPGRRQRGGSRG